MKITTQDVYKKLQNVEEMIHRIKEDDLPNIIKAQALANGTVKFHTKLIWLLAGASASAFAFLIVWVQTSCVGCG